MATVDGAEPCFLYNNVLGDNTLAVPSGSGASLATGALANIHDGLTFTTATFSGLSGADLIIDITSGAGAAATDAFGTIEDPLATGWTDRGDQPLRQTSTNVQESTSVLTGSEVRLYTFDASQLTNGKGYVQADILRPLALPAGSNDAGVVLYDSSDGSWLAYMGSSGQMKSYNAGTTTRTDEGALVGGSVTGITYTIRLSWDGSVATARWEASTGAILSGSMSPTGVPVGFKPDLVGMIQTVCTDLGMFVWDNFESNVPEIKADTFAMSGQLFQGATGADVAGTYTLGIQYSADGTTWKSVTPDGWAATTPAIAADATVFLRWDSPGYFHYWRLVFTDVDLTPSGSVTLAAVCLGTRLEFPEWMSTGFDPDAVSLAWEQNRNMSGQYVGGVVRNARQGVNLKFTSAGFASTFFHDPDGAGDIGDRRRMPSWGHFLKTNWSLGKPWWFQWRAWDKSGGVHVHEGSFYSYPSSKSRAGAPFISPARRKLRFSFDVMAEGYVGDMPLNDE